MKAAKLIDILALVARILDITLDQALAIAAKIHERRQAGEEVTDGDIDEVLGGLEAAVDEGDAIDSQGPDEAA